MYNIEKGLGIPDYINQDLVAIASKYTGLKSKDIVVTDGYSREGVTTDYREYTASCKGDIIFRFRLVGFPGCCGIMISYNTYINGDYRNKGLGTELNKYKQLMAKFYGYSILMCTDVESNLPQRNVLKNNRWEDIFSFVNRNTYNLVNVSCCRLINEEKDIPAAFRPAKQRSRIAMDNLCQIVWHTITLKKFRNIIRRMF